MEPNKNRWIITKEEIVAAPPAFQILKRECHSSEDQRKHSFYVLRSRDWCNIIPITEDGKVVLVRQYRIGIDNDTVEIPGGVADADDQNFQDTAIREMTEETGYVPLPGARCLPVVTNYPNPAIQGNRVHSFIIGPVRKETSQNLDSGEMIDVLEVPIAEIPRMINNGEIDHALILNAFLSLAFQSKAAQEKLIRTMQSFCAL